MSYPAYLFKHLEIQPNLFICQKDNKRFFLFGTYHVLPLSVIPKAYVDIMKSATTLLLEIFEPSTTEADLIAGGFVTREPQTKGLHEKLNLEARKILENAIQRYCSSKGMASIPLNRIELDRALWLCRFATNIGGMEDALESLFPNNVFGLERRTTSQHLNKTSIDELNGALLSSFECLKDIPEYPPEILAPMEEYLVGASLFNPHYSYYQEIEPELVVARNRNWIPEILRHLQIGTPLVAVGHTHLVGRTGLLCLLQQEGFQISQYAPQENSFDPFMPDVFFKSLAENRAIAEQVETLLSTKIEEERCSLVLEYWAPSILFSSIYPNSKSEHEATELTSRTEKSNATTETLSTRTSASN